MNQKGLARETVVSAALTLLDEVGLDGLTVRRLAAELGVQSPALYWHFRDKRELLDQMAEALLAPDMGGPREGESWRAWLTRRAHQARRRLLGHRDGARLIVGANPGMAVARQFEAELRVLVGHGFTPAQALQAVGSLSYYITGFVLAEQAALGRRQGGGADQLATYASEVPMMVAAYREGGAPTGDRAFAYGLSLIVDGMAAVLGAGASPSAEPGDPLT